MDYRPQLDEMTGQNKVGRRAPDGPKTPALSVSNYRDF
jgi:hypothetical protein